VNVRKSAIGEFNERTSLFLDTSQKFIDGLRLSTSTIERVDSSLVTFKSHRFGDSSGLGSYSNSSRALRKAILEFYERQSFIFHWVNHVPGKIVNSRVLSKLLGGSRSFTLLNLFFPKILVSSISIFNGVYVTVLLGISSSLKVLGLGSGFSLKESVKEAVNESVESLSGTRMENNDLDISQKNGDQSSITIRNGLTNIEYYARLSPLELLKEFSFLFEAGKNELMVNDSDEFEANYLQYLRENELHYNIEIIGVGVLGPNELKLPKIIKVISTEGYPYMYPPYFSRDQMRAYLKGNSEEHQWKTPIPFP
jgi:hypothetical protein